MKAQDYLQLDQVMSRKIMKQFEGKEIEVTCDTCQGRGYFPTPFFKRKKKKWCHSCGGKGKYLMAF